MQTNTASPIAGVDFGWLRNTREVNRKGTGPTDLKTSSHLHALHGQTETPFLCFRATGSLKGRASRHLSMLGEGHKTFLLPKAELRGLVF